MKRTHREFVGSPTVSPGKHQITNWMLQQSTIPHPEKTCLYLVGDVSGLKRHVNDKRDLGFVDILQHMVCEIADHTFNALACEARMNSEFDGLRLCRTDIVDLAEKHPFGSIGHLDYDTASAFTRTELNNLIRLCSCGIDNIHAVFVQRNRTNELSLLWPERPDVTTGLGGQYEWLPRGGVMKYGPPRQSDIMYALLEHHIGDRYDFYIRPYRGVGTTPMIGIVLNRLPS